jgi:hypothetical protein
MIHHISIAAHNPQLVSQVLAEVLQGTSLPFPGVILTVGLLWL